MAISGEKPPLPFCQTLLRLGLPLPSTVSFRALVGNSPEHQRAPEALLSVANCQSELKDAKGARRTLEDLVKAYPTSEAAVAARERLVALK